MRVQPNAAITMPQQTTGEDQREGGWAIAFSTAFVLILCIAVVLRAYGMSFGLPFLYDFDEPTFSDRAFLIIETGDLNPHWFGHPGTTLIYLLAAAYGIYGLVGMAAGWFASWSDVTAQYWWEPSHFYLIGRGVIAAFGILTVVLTYAVARRLSGRWTALLAMAIVAVAPLTIEYSRIIRPDSQLSVIVLACLWFSMAYAEQGRLRDLLLAGAVLGIGVATKYPALTLTPIICLAWLLWAGWSFSAWIRYAPRLIAAGAVSVAAAFVASPFLFFDIHTAINDVIMEGERYHLSATSDGYFSTLQWYVGGILTPSLTIAGLLLAGFGLILMVRSWQRSALLLCAYAVMLLLVLSGMRLRWDRWALPLIPLLAILAAFGFSNLIRIVVAPKASRLGMAMVAALVCAWLAIPTARSVERARGLASDYTISLAWEWVMENVEPGAVVLGERYTPQLPRDRYTLLEAQEHGGIGPVRDRGQAFLRADRAMAVAQDVWHFHEAGVQYVMLGNDFDRRVAEGAREQDAVLLYEHIMDCGELLYQKNPEPGRVAGTPVRIYRIDQACDR